ncbi:hypothetical protein ABZ461_00185 [Actinacidiphila glaucinigra]|uniref:hypothetical protein n=1 Tax=Actinacidiphila glaucinigra TaxID=235986 RepID=UPI0033F2BA04
MDRLPAELQPIRDRELALPREASVYHESPVRHTITFAWEAPDGADDGLAVIVSSGMLPVPAVGGHVAVHGHDVRVVAVRTSYTRSDDEGVPLLFTRVTVAPPR